MLPNCFELFFILLKLELLTQFQLQMTKNNYIYEEISHFRSTEHLQQNILAIGVEFVWSEICLKTHIRPRVKNNRSVTEGHC